MKTTINVNREVKKSKRADVHKVDPLALVVDEGFNIRKDYGDIEELAKSISERGVMVPLRGYKEKDENGNEKYVIVDGHRRHQAIKHAMEEMGSEVEFVPMIIEPRGYSKEDRILDMFTLNDSKNITPLEEGELFKRLVNLEWSVNRIAEKTGRSVPHVYKMIALANSPVRFQKKIQQGEITANTVSQIMREAKTEEEQEELINSAIDSAQQEGKKATGRHVNSKSKPSGTKKVNVMKNTAQAIHELEKEEFGGGRLQVIKEYLELISQKPEVDEIVEFLKK